MTDLPAPLPKPLKAVSPRKPVTKLDARGRRLIDLMTGGFDTPEEAAKWGLNPFEPLSLEQAAAPSGLRRGNARFLFTQPAFLKAFNENLVAYRNGSKALAIKTMVAVMHDQGENSAADRAVRLKASQAIMGDSEGRGGSVNVTVNNGAAQMVAGVCIRLPANVAQPPLEIMDHRDRLIDASPIDSDRALALEEKFTTDPEAAPAMARNWPITSTGKGDD